LFILAQGAGELEAVDAGQTQVGDDQIGRLLARQRQGVLGIVRAPDRKACRL